MKLLGGENYVFWGGCEGYQIFLNIDLKKEFDYMVWFFFFVIKMDVMFYGYYVSLRLVLIFFVEFFVFIMQDCICKVLCFVDYLDIFYFVLFYFKQLF